MRLQVAVGVVQDASGRVLINCRPDGKPRSGQWEFPGGKIEPGETPWLALVREFREELGLQLISGEPLMRVEYDYPERSVALSVWSVGKYRGAPSSLEGQPFRWCDASALERLDMLPANAPIVAWLLGQEQSGR